MAEPTVAGMQELAAILPPSRVSQHLADRLAYRHGTWAIELKGLENGNLPLPAAVAWPQSAEEVQTLVDWAYRWRVPLIPYGGGSGIVGGTGSTEASLMIDTKALRAVIYDTASQVVDAGAGWFGGELDAWLRDHHGVTLAHYPQSLHSSTVGGWLATRATGILSTKYGRIEDRVEGIEVVLGTGERLILGGGPPASEGPDLLRLFLGSEGRFGIITRARLRVEPGDLPEVIRVWAVRDVASGLAVIQWLVQHGVRPTVTRLFDPEESGVWFPDLADGGAVLLLHFQGLAPIIGAEAAVAEEQARQQGARQLPNTVGQGWWNRRFDTSALLTSLRRPGTIAETIEVGASWTHLSQVYHAMRSALRPLCTRVYAHFSHFYASGGSVYVIIETKAPAAEEDAVRAWYHKVLAQALTASLNAGGGVSHHHGIGRARVPWLERARPDAVQLLRTLRPVLDPHGICNPGVLFEEGSPPA